LTAPVSAALARGRLPSIPAKVLARAAGVGLALAALLYALGRGFEPWLPEAMEVARATKPDPTSGLLASLYGGIVEEIVSRLFLLSVLAWGLRAMVARRDADLPTGVFWAANLIAAVAFGLLHAPAMAVTGTPLTPAVWAYLMLLNGVAGAMFGLQYRTHGLEVAMVAHFAADVGLHAIIPLLGL
jgi:membrane protease YdiL (CAAX protease family)